MKTTLAIYIQRDGQQWGPYTVEQINEYLAQGSLLVTDYGWAEGWPQWEPLYEIAGVDALKAHKGIVPVIIRVLPGLVLLEGILFFLICVLGHILPPVSIYIGLGGGFGIIMAAVLSGEAAVKSLIKGGKINAIISVTLVFLCGTMFTVGAYLICEERLKSPWW